MILDKVDTKSSKKVSMTIKPDFKNAIIAKI